MSKNAGKVFEENWRKSCPKDVLIYRPPDSAGSFGGGKNLRFSAKSPCDYMIYDGDNLWTLELKTVVGRISFERLASEKGDIHFHQLQKLHEFARFSGVISGLVIEFRNDDVVTFININQWNDFIDSLGDKKSFSAKDLSDSLIYIPRTLIRTNYKYDVGQFLAESKERWSD